MKSVKGVALDLGISEQRLRALCLAGRVKGAELVGKTWILPEEVIITSCKRSGNKNQKLTMTGSSDP